MGHLPYPYHPRPIPTGVGIDSPLLRDRAWSLCSNRSQLPSSRYHSLVGTLTCHGRFWWFINVINVYNGLYLAII